MILFSVRVQFIFTYSMVGLRRIFIKIYHKQKEGLHIKQLMRGSIVLCQQYIKGWMFTHSDIVSEEKIDIYDSKQKVLIERKRKITTIYDGYILQLYAQYHALTEMGYFVKEIRLYSLVDNKTYPIALPEDDNNHQEMFEHTLQAIRDFQLEDFFHSKIL